MSDKEEKHRRMEIRRDIGNRKISLREVDQFVEQYPDHELRIAELDRSLLPSEK